MAPLPIRLNIQASCRRLDDHEKYLYASERVLGETSIINAVSRCGRLLFERWAGLVRS